MSSEKKTTFTSIHNHTYASNQRFIDSINRPEQMIAKAIKLGFSGLAFTDHESLSLGVTLLKLRDKIKETNPDFKIIFGNEIYLIPDEAYKNTRDYYHFILIAKDAEGYQQLKELSSRAWERSYFERGVRRCPTLYSDFEEIIRNKPGHLIGSSACLGSIIDKSILARDSDTLNTFIPWCISVFGKDNFFLETQAAGSEEQIACNQYLIKLAEYFAIDYIVTTDSHYLDKEDFSLFSAFLNSKSSSDRETESFYKYTYIMSIEEMTEILREGGMSPEDIDRGINNTQKIYNMVEDFDFRHSTIIPSIKLPKFQVDHILKDWYEKYPMIKHVAYSKYDQDRYMLHLIEVGIQELHFSITETSMARLNEELDVIIHISKEIKQDVSAYLNLVRTIIDICWKTTFIGAGRGSSGAFLINYLMQITQTNPLDYNIPSFRFLHKERGAAGGLPDVDIDLSPLKMDTVMSLLREYFGKDNVLNCATFKTESLKSAILTAMRGMGKNNDEAQSLAALVPSHRGRIYTLEDCLYGNEELNLDPVPNFEEKLRQHEGLFEMVQKIEGLPTNASQHASAVYITNQSYLELTSFMRSPGGTPITAMSMADVDACGGLKLDLLRTDAEAKLMKAVELLLNDGLIQWQGSLKATYDKYIHPRLLLEKDDSMWDKLNNGEITNAFQMETAVGQVGLQKMTPHSVRELAAVNGLIRLQAEDGEETSVDRYSRFKNNPEEWDKEMDEAGLTEDEKNLLKRHLSDKYGIAYSQEDLMLLLMDPQIGNFSLKEADHVRKIVSKKKLDEIEAFKDEFFSKKYGEES